LTALFQTNKISFSFSICFLGGLFWHLLTAFISGFYCAFLLAALFGVRLLRPQLRTRQLAYSVYVLPFSPRQRFDFAAGSDILTLLFCLIAQLWHEHVQCVFSFSPPPILLTPRHLC
jgi:hypothetical protein